MILNYSEISQRERTNLLYSTIIPRPIAWIVTEDNGVVNIAPFSFFSGISSSPPVVMVAIGNRQDGTPKDTLRNIRNTKKATICVVNENYFEKMKSSAEPIPSHQSESEVFDIEVERVEHDFPPAIKGVESAMFCKLHSEIEFEGNTTPIFLEVVKHFVDDSSMIDESLKLNLIGRIGKTFAKVIEIE